VVGLLIEWTQTLQTVCMVQRLGKASVVNRALLVTSESTSVSSFRPLFCLKYRPLEECVKDNPNGYSKP